jgi:DNA polymerase I-like protein with 3'-5' exonuclease and polymerase domains
MLTNCDAKQLEWVCAGYLSHDPVAMEEIRNGVDTHQANQVAFGLPDRGIAKIFLFRLIYGGSAYSYAHDPDFTDVSTSQTFWEGVISKTYNKYKGLAEWHNNLMREVVATGRLQMPTGRIYQFDPATAEEQRTQILNYPVQGLGADLMSIARVSLRRKMIGAGLISLLVCTVHDSIVVDGPTAETQKVCKLMFDVFKDIPSNFKRLFGVEFDLPMRCEVSIGNNWEDTVEIKEEFINAD